MMQITYLTEHTVLLGCHNNIRNKQGLTAQSTPSLPISLGIGWAFDRLTVSTMEHLLSKGCLGDLAVLY